MADPLEKTQFQVVYINVNGALSRHPEPFDLMVDASAQAIKTIETRPEIVDAFVVSVVAAFSKKFAFEQTI